MASPPDPVVADLRLPGDPPVLAACSGGPDSVALLHLLVAAGAPVVAAGHVDHGLRPGSADDADVVRGHGESLGVPVLTTRVTVATSGSVEANAREARWSALRKLAAEAGAEVIAAAHTADDQAETVLMRLARGAGTTGVASMRPLADGIWRPLLNVRRRQLRAMCRARGWAVVEDPSNDDRRYERNRIRLDVLPVLGPRSVPALARAARLAADEDDFLESLLDGAPLERRPDGAVAIGAAWLASVHPALARRAVRRAARWAGAEYPLPAERVEDVRRGKAASLGGGLSSWRERDVVVVGRRYLRPS